MLLYSPNWLFLYPGLFCMIVGITLGLWLWTGPKIIGRIGLDVHTLVYAAFLVLLGFHTVLFALLARTYAAHEGLFPQPDWLTRAQRHVQLETGVITGGLLLAAGFGGSIVAVRGWQVTGFGALSPSEALRVVVPSGLLFTLGAEVLLGSFLLSLLGLGVRAASSSPSGTR